MEKGIQVRFYYISGRAAQSNLLKYFYLKQMWFYNRLATDISYCSFKEKKKKPSSIYNVLTLKNKTNLKENIFFQDK